MVSVDVEHNVHLPSLLNLKHNLSTTLYSQRLKARLKTVIVSIIHVMLPKSNTHATTAMGLLHAYVAVVGKLQIVSVV